MIFSKNIFKIVGKVFIGIVSTLIVETIFIMVIYRLIPGYADPLPFIFKYPLITVSLLGFYFAFWKKQYAFTIGLVLGFVVFMIITTFLFEVLAGPATL